MPAPAEVLARFWQEASSRLQPSSLAEERFTPEARAALEGSALDAGDIYALTPILDRFLKSLGRSHAGFHSDRELVFYLYRSMFTTRDVDQPQVAHAGMRHNRDADGWTVREVWDGTPADDAGLRPGDRILSVNGEPYHPFSAFNGAGGAVSEVTLEVRRGSETRTVTLTPVWQNPNRSMLEATRNSARTIDLGNGLEAGYLHLWAGTHGDVLPVFLQAVESLADTDALILDLRGGFGGAWYEFLDPFFPSRDGFFEYTIIDNESRTDFGPETGNRFGGETRPEVIYYDRPMVVLIDGGTRSGKESLAFQFKKSGRAVLVGRTTAGAFTAGQGVFTDPALPYFLFIPVAEVLLDGQTIEGIGVAPDEQVDPGWPADRQLERAVAIARTLAAAQT